MSAPRMTRRGWMVCDESSRPGGTIHGTEEEVRARLAASVPAETPRGNTIRAIQAINAARSARWMAGSPGWTTLEIAGELAGEVGELANICKKLRRSEMGVPGNKVSDDELRIQARGEIADVFIVLMLTASKLGIDLEDAVRDTFNAKSEQMGFPEKIPEKNRPRGDCWICGSISCNCHEVAAAPAPAPEAAPPSAGAGEAVTLGKLGDLNDLMNDLYAAVSDLRLVSIGGQCDPRTLTNHCDVLRGHAERIAALASRPAVEPDDTALVNAAEAGEWAIAPQVNGGWVIEATEAPGIAGDCSPREIARTRGSLREALAAARRAEQEGGR